MHTAPGTCVRPVRICMAEVRKNPGPGSLTPSFPERINNPITLRLIQIAEKGFCILLEVLTNHQACLQGKRCKTVSLFSVEIVINSFLVQNRLDNGNLALGKSGGKLNITRFLRKRGSFGLLGMRERIFALRGCFDIKGAPGKGTTLNISLPLKKSD